MVKATAGGGGMGLVVCRSPDQLSDAVDTVREEFRGWKHGINFVTGQE